MTSLKSNVITGVKWSALSRGFVALAQLLQVAVVARFVCKDDFGLIGVALLVNSFCSIFVDMGLAAAAMHEQNLSTRQFASFYWFNVLLGLLLTIVVSMSSPWVAAYYHRDELMGIISVTSLVIFFQSIFSLQRTLQQKKMNFRFMALVDISAAAVLFCSNLLLAFNGYGVFSLAYSSLLSSVFSAVVYLWYAIFRERNILFHFDFKEVHKALKIGIYQVGSSTLDFFSREMDSLIISSGYTMELFGVYSLCKQLTFRVYVVINPIITNVLTPAFAQIQNNKAKVSDSYIKTINILGFLNFPLYSIIAYASLSILTILYGESYSEYAYLLAFLAFFYAFQSCGNPVGSLLVALGRTDKGFYWTLFRIGFTSIYLYVASRCSFEIFAFLVFLMAFFTMYPSWLIMLKSLINVSFWDNFMLTMKPFSLCLILSPLYYLDQVIDNPWLSVFVIASFFILGYVLLNRMLRKGMWQTIVTMVESNIKQVK